VCVCVCGRGGGAVCHSKRSVAVLEKAEVISRMFWMLMISMRSVKCDDNVIMSTWF
jgi:hypothetical protein